MLLHRMMWHVWHRLANLRFAIGNLQRRVVCRHIDLLIWIASRFCVWLAAKPSVGRLAWKVIWIRDTIIWTKRSYNVPLLSADRLTNWLIDLLIAWLIDHIWSLLYKLLYKPWALSMGDRNFRPPAPHSSETTGPIFMKLEICNYFPDTIRHPHSQGAMTTWVVWANSPFDAWKFLSLPLDTSLRSDFWG